MAIGDKKATRESYGIALSELGDKYDCNGCGFIQIYKNRYF